MFTEECWKAISGFEGVYEVSDHGRVRSLDREIVMTWKGKEVRKFRNGKMMKPMIKSGYPTYHLRNEAEGLEKWVTGHRLVAINFIPNPSGYKVIDHINDDKTCNHYTNLLWCSTAYNTKKAREQGRFLSGNARYQAKLTVAMVLDVEKLLESGLGVKAIARELPISERSVIRIKNKEHKLCSDYQA